eukprot:419194-Pyramimonas_sp.AAC.1
MGAAKHSNASMSLTATVDRRLGSDEIPPPSLSAEPLLHLGELGPHHVVLHETDEVRRPLLGPHRIRS